MKQIRKYLLKFLLFMTVIVLFFSCNQYDNDIEPTRDNNKSFYKEIFFGSVKSSKLNHVKEMIASRSSTQKSTANEMERMETILTDKIEELNPDFFTEFNSKIQSGDHILIEQALNEGGAMLEQSLYSTPELAEELLLGEKIANEIDINDYINQDGTLDAEALKDYIELNYQDELAIISPTFIFAAVYVVAAVSVAAAVNYAGAVNVYVWFNAWKWTNGPKKVVGKISPAGSSLQLEMLINEIAVNYSK